MLSSCESDQEEGVLGGDQGQVLDKGRSCADPLARLSVVGPLGQRG